MYIVIMSKFVSPQKCAVTLYVWSVKSVIIASPKFKLVHKDIKNLWLPSSIKKYLPIHWIKLLRPSQTTSKRYSIHALNQAYSCSILKLSVGLHIIYGENMFPLFQAGGYLQPNYQYSFINNSSDTWAFQYSFINHCSNAWALPKQTDRGRGRVTSLYSPFFKLQVEPSHVRVWGERFIDQPLN